jgi:hypothetical protein
MDSVLKVSDVSTIIIMNAFVARSSTVIKPAIPLETRHTIMFVNSLMVITG